MERNFWWISNTQTHKYQIEEGHLWSPKVGKVDRNLYQDMLYVEKGDVIFPYAHQKISYIGIAESGCRPAQKPQSYNDNDWDKDGFMIPVSFYKLQKPIDKAALNSNYDELVELLPQNKSPLYEDPKNKKHFKAKQAYYIKKLNKPYANKLFELIGEVEVDRILSNHIPSKERKKQISKQVRGLSDIELLKSIKGKSESVKAQTDKKKKGSTSTKPPKPKYDRDPKVKEYVYRRANGKCELCNEKAPFTTDKRPYLESHHIIWLSEDPTGDTIENSVALCPNCHKKMHHNSDKSELNRDIEKLYNLYKYSSKEHESI